MTDETSKIKTEFEQYAAAFQLLKPAKVLPFFHFPVMLITPERTAIIGNPIVGYLGFKKAMNDLKRRCFTRSEARSIQVQHLSDNLAIVTGIVIRYKRCKDDGQETILECFNLNYTMQKVKGDWKIIIGILTEITCPPLQNDRASEPQISQVEA